MRCNRRAGRPNGSSRLAPVARHTRIRDRETTGPMRPVTLGRPRRLIPPPASRLSLPLVAPLGTSTRATRAALISATWPSRLPTIAAVSRAAITLMVTEPGRMSTMVVRIWRSGPARAAPSACTRLQRRVATRAAAMGRGPERRTRVTQRPQTAATRDRRTTATRDRRTTVTPGRPTATGLRTQGAGRRSARSTIGSRSGTTGDRTVRTTGLRRTGGSRWRQSRGAVRMQVATTPGAPIQGAVRTQVATTPGEPTGTSSRIPVEVLSERTTGGTQTWVPLAATPSRPARARGPPATMCWKRDDAGDGLRTGTMSRSRRLLSQAGTALPGRLA